MRKLIISLLLVSVVMTSMLAGMGGTVYAKDLTEVKAAYYKVMDAKVKQYGILTEDDMYYNSGVGFAELVDFDNNGTPELYVIYADGDQNYVQEVWTYSGGQAKRIFERSTYGYGRVNDEGVSLLKTTSNQTYLSINSGYSTGMGDLPYSNQYFLTNIYYKMSNGQMKEFLRLTEIDESSPDDSVKPRTRYEVTENNKERSVSSAQYQELLKKHGIDNKKHRYLIYGNAGSPTFNDEIIAISNNHIAINNFIKGLSSEYLYSMKNEYTAMSLTEKNSLVSLLYKFFSQGRVDMTHPSDASIIRFIKNAAHDGILGESIYEYDNNITYGDYIYYNQHDPQLLNRLAKEMFGLQLELKENGFAKFQDGYFYTQSYEFGSDTGGYSPQVSGLYALGGGYYYALLDIHSWDVYEHDFYNANQAIETWTGLEKSYISDVTTGYAIVKKLDSASNGSGWNVVVADDSGALLTQKEFKQYQTLVKTAATPDAWAQKEVNEAKAAQLIPHHLDAWYGANINREEFSRLIITMIERYEGKTIEAVLIERDLSINRNRFYDTEDLSVLAANALGIVNGKTEDTFSPEQSITRQEAAVMLARAADVLAFKKGSTAISYSDSKKIASWAAESVKFVSTAKDKTNNAAVMGGTGNNQFSPLGNLTKQQAIIAVKRLFNAK